MSVTIVICPFISGWFSYQQGLLKGLGRVSTIQGHPQFYLQKNNITNKKILGTRNKSCNAKAILSLRTVFGVRRREKERHCNLSQLYHRNFESKFRHQMLLHVQSGCDKAEVKSPLKLLLISLNKIQCQLMCFTVQMSGNPNSHSIPLGVYSHPIHSL